MLTIEISEEGADGTTVNDYHSFGKICINK